MLRPGCQCSKRWGGRRLGAVNITSVHLVLPKNVTLGRTAEPWLKLLMSECDLEQCVGRAGLVLRAPRMVSLGHPFGNWGRRALVEQEADAWVMTAVGRDAEAFAGPACPWRALSRALTQHSWSCGADTGMGQQAPFPKEKVLNSFSASSFLLIIPLHSPTPPG